MISIDDRRAAREAAAHLIRFGHTRLGIIAMELRSDQYEGTVDARRIEAATFPNALARLQGYQDVMREAGLDPSNVLKKKLVRLLYPLERKVCLRKAARPSGHETKPQAYETSVLKLA